jgi:hypothetical protein
MTNRSKAKGTAGETALVRWLRLNGFPGADRQPLRGNRDAGDLVLSPGLVMEVKNYAGPPAVGQPAAEVLGKWMAQAELERAHADADHCPLVVKRRGTADPGRWFAYIPAAGFAELVGANVPHLPEPSAPMCTSVASLTTLLRHAGYGSPLEDEAGDVA